MDFGRIALAFRGHRRTYLTILKLADHALFKMVWYVLLRPLRPELEGQDPFQNIGLLCQTRKTPTLRILVIIQSLLRDDWSIDKNVKFKFKNKIQNLDSISKKKYRYR
jgi:hypothetical protein